MLVVIPARGASKRLPRKNIVPLAGRPLLDYTLDLVRTAGLTKHAVVSTDDAEIARLAEAGGVGVIARPAELSVDTASTESALLHALEQRGGAAAGIDWVLTLPPTSPFRAPASLRRLLAMAEQAPADLDCLMSVTETRGDFWRRSGARWHRLFPDAPRRQQDREPLFEENSAFYLTRSIALVDTGSILGRRVEGVPVDRLEGFDINTLADLPLAEAIIASGLVPHLQRQDKR